MQQVEFFLFALFVIWFANSGKLRALWQALRSDPPKPSASSTASSGGDSSGGTGSPTSVETPGIGPTIPAMPV